MRNMHFCACFLLISILICNINVIYCQSAPPSQETKIVTGEDLYKLIINRERGVDYDRASYFVRDTYAKELNNGEVPDWRTVFKLKELIKKYKISHENELGLPAEVFLINALREAPSRIKEERAYWKKAKEVAELYFRDPTPGKANNLALALPENRDQISSFLDAKGKDILRNYIIGNLSILEDGIESGEPYAVDVAFRLLNFSDGWYQERLCFILGELLVPKHPELFLRKALIYESRDVSAPFNHLGCILLMTAELGEIPEAGNDPEKYKQITQERLKRRVQALESVTEPTLREIRDLCLSILRKAIHISNEQNYGYYL